MSFQLENFADPNLNEDYLRYLLDQEAIEAGRHFSRLWDYFRNPIVPAGPVAAGAFNNNSRPYFQAQEIGLPARLTGINRYGLGGESLAGIARKEVVIENDIAWRVGAMVDFLFGKPVSIRSLAGDKDTAAAVEAVLGRLFEANGGEGFFQELALLGSIYGFVDIVIRPPAEWAAMAAQLASPSASRGPAAAEAPRPVTPFEDAGSGPAAPRSKPSTQSAATLAGLISLETVEAGRVLPILDDDDFRSVRYWVQCYRKATADLDDDSPIQTFGLAGRRLADVRTVEVVEIISPAWWQRYEDRMLVGEGPNILGRLPVAHIQNLALPGHYDGLSDVEPLVPLQDELNTRLSDRASRVTFQSFKMYLAKGIENFLERPVGPGQMWATHNPEASVQEFGQDNGSPSEDAHIDQVRQALDKISGVTPLAAGLIHGNVGNLTSGTALKVLLAGLLSRTQRKRITYGRGIARIAELVLELLDRAGALKTKPEDRRIEIHWPSPLPEDQSQQLADAQAKAALGVPARRVLAELGYDEQQLSQ